MRVCDTRPTPDSTIFSAGVASLRRTSAVFTRSVSTKESRAPLMDFSSVGSETGRAHALRTSKLTARHTPSNSSRQQPWVSRSVSSMT